MKMKRYFWLVGYWLVHGTGICPLMLKNENGKVSSWAPWVWTKRSIVVGLGQVVLILFDTIRRSAWYSGGLDDFKLTQKFLLILVTDMFTMTRTLMTLIVIIGSLFRHREIQSIFNNICTLYFDVLQHTDAPELWRFTYVIALHLIEIVVSGMWISIVDSSNSSYVEDIFQQLPYRYTVEMFQIALAIVLIYTQNILVGLNRKIKDRFPRIAPRDWENRKSVVPSLASDDLMDVKEFLADCRLAYRRVTKIARDLSSVYGTIWLLTLVLNEAGCMLFVYSCNSLLFTNVMGTEVAEGGSLGRAFLMAVVAATSLLNITVMLDNFENVVKEAQITTFYVASIDASEIDRDSKMELIEFLEEIEVNEIGLTAGNVISLGYPTLYSSLKGTVTNILFVIQYLTPQNGKK